MAQKESGWGDIFWGVVCLLIAGGSYVMFTKLEDEGGKVRMPAIVLVAYKALGKTGTAALFGGIGGLLIVYGASKFRSQGPDEEETSARSTDEGTP